MAKQDILQSLEYRRIKDTYHSVLFVDNDSDKLNNTPTIYNGDGIILPFSFSTNAINLSGVNINCVDTLNHTSANITKISTLTANKIHTQTLILSSSTGNNMTYQSEFDTNNKSIIPNHIVKPQFIELYNVGATIFNSISSDFIPLNCTHTNRNDTYNNLTFTIHDTEYNSHYIVIIAMAMVNMYETEGNVNLQLNNTVIQTKWFRMAVSGDYGGGGRIPITYVYTIPPKSSEAKNGENTLRVFTDNSKMTAYFSDITILHGASL